MPGSGSELLPLATLAAGTTATRSKSFTLQRAAGAASIATFTFGFFDSTGD